MNSKCPCKHCYGAILAPKINQLRTNHQACTREEEASKGGWETGDIGGRSGGWEDRRAKAGCRKLRKREEGN